jgi:hypothetical protein
MSTIEKHDAADDLEEVIRLLPQRGVRDPELLRRIRERSARVLRQLGETNMAVELIQSARDEE